jgi:hypothetical protein
MKRWISTVVACSLAVLSVQVGLTAAASKSGSHHGPSWPAWNQPCGFSHRNHDDPIRFPGQPGRSHDHTYFGNRSTNAASTPASLRRNGRTTCGGRADRSAYWVPTLSVGGKAAKPLGVVTQYLRRTYEPVTPFPTGLKMIAGNLHAHTAQSQRVTSWSCAVPASPRASTMPVCASGRRGGLALRVVFPDCWDGKRLDSPDHQSHMAYSSKGVCPRSHPVEVPGLTIVVRYRVAGGPTAELASGGQFSGHADFMNGWKQAKLATLIGHYLNAPDSIGPPREPPDPTGPPPCERCPGR